MSLDRPEAQDPYQKLPKVGSFTLTSADLTDGQPLPAKHAYEGVVEGAENVSPHLSWSGAPEGTQSYVVTCYDPDAPTPSGFWHWIIVDLPLDVTELATNAGASGDSLPDTAFMVRNDYSTKDYGGAYPPEGDRPHRYYFVVHAVDVESLNLDDNASAAYVSFNLAFHTLARAQLVATFQR